MEMITSSGIQSGLNMVLLYITAGVIWHFWRFLYHTVRAASFFEVEHYLALGILLTAIGVFLRRTWWLSSKISRTDFPLVSQWFEDSVGWFNMMTLLVIVGYTLHIMSITPVNQWVKVWRRIYIGVPLIFVFGWWLGR